MLEKGVLLLSEPFLNDPNFERSVILLCDHDEKSSLGLVLNKPTEYYLNEVVPNFEGSKHLLFVGGPVEHNTLHYLHTRGEQVKNSVHLTDNLYIGGNFDQIKALIMLGRIQPEEIRFFMGYTGWGAGQLEEEIKNNTWIICNTDLESILDMEITGLWKFILKQKGGKYREMANYPLDPRLN